MDFSNLKKNQPVVVKLIKNSFEQKRLFHTYLFTGQRGSLKMDAAIYLASLVLCENGGECKECDECKKLDKWSNEHLFIVSPDGETIKKEQIENLEHEFGYSSETPRVFIIQNIDRATLTASNTLLKFLEELPNNCYGVLITENINKVIPTIKSRSQIVNFRPISSDVVYQDLISKNINQEKAQIIAHITNNMSLGNRYSKDKDIDKTIELVKGISESFEESNNGYLGFMKNGEFLRDLDRDKNRIFLDLLVTIQDDKINYLINRRDNLVFSSIEYTNVNLDKKTEVKILETILKFRERLDSNANLDMVYTQMFVEIGRIFE